MEEHIEDIDCLYENLPGTSAASSTLNEKNLSSSNKENIASFPISDVNKKDTTIDNNSKTPVKRCACRQRVQWAWDCNSKSENVEVVNDNMDVKFHRNFSNGTAVVRCTEPMSNNQYYWEVKMISPVYGTDIMVGVGTSEARMHHVQDRFVSLLGMDNKSWGLSYTGLFHHSGRRRVYAESFGQGNTIGVHLDLWKGTLSFYKDRKHLGVASSGLKGKTLYAMASSTAARSGMRIIHSTSFPSSLQFLCCSKLRELIPDDKNVLDVVDIPIGLKQYLESKLSWLLDKRYLEKDLDFCCTVEDDQNDGKESENEPPRVFDPFGISGQFVLLGSVLLSDFNRHNRLRARNEQESDESSENEAKRQRLNYNYPLGVPDQDSD